MRFSLPSITIFSIFLGGLLPSSVLAYTRKSLIMIASSDADDSFPSGTRREFGFGEGAFCGIELTKDGNLVVQSLIYRSGSDRWVTKWESGTAHANPAESYYLHLQNRHGNLVIYEGKNLSNLRVIWSAQTAKIGTEKLYITDLCDLILEGDDQRADWSTVGSTFRPTTVPSQPPSSKPSFVPTTVPSLIPSTVPSKSPSANPSARPSGSPSDSPSVSPSNSPSASPSDAPSVVESEIPSDTPSSFPIVLPSDSPSLSPSASPSNSAFPSSSPSIRPTEQRNTLASQDESSSPTMSDVPSSTPTTVWTESIILAPSAPPSSNLINADNSTVTTLATLAPTIISVTSAPTIIVATPAPTNAPNTLAPTGNTTSLAIANAKLQEEGNSADIVGQETLEQEGSS